MKSAELLGLSATELSRLIHARKVAPSEVMAAWLERVASVNGAVNAIVSLRDPDDLMAEARALDDVAPVGWLHGIPLAIKDLLATKGLRTTYGSPLYADFLPEADDLVVARIRTSGAVIAGKTNTPEWGQGSHSFNPVHGVTRNPYDLARSAGGSSGGAAAALASGMAWVADGSDMMGSLRNPAGFCNVYGLRPTWGLVPGDAGGETHLATLATEGPMARTVEDLARFLGVMAGENRETPFPRALPDLLSGLEAGVKGKKIGWLGDWGGAYPMEPGILAACEAGLRVLEDLGAEVETLPPPFPAQELWQAWIALRAMLNAGGKSDLARDPAKRALTKAETIWEIERGAGLTAAEVYAASEIRSRWYRDAARMFDRFDAVVLPSAQVWPFPAEWRWPEEIAGVRMDTYHRWMEVVVPASLIGLPALSVPLGFGPQGLPSGMQIIGRSGDDAGVLAIGQAYHRATLWPQRQPALAAGAVSR
ncbi:amidase [Xinfangfangia sp. CPCC 101601]|uniref:Amidase n=1 Tax=Pseudogemmobacter lacusdianii TaxID=3069608 RepID=A0ABU0VVP5_9RHOB|nr:amidase [Xinfangfangia sp. CPCC 101601]MDQ2065789.1 amidase [Xinfangfangia sp. CPCC 101601]